MYKMRRIYERQENKIVGFTCNYFSTLEGI